MATGKPSAFESDLLKLIFQNTNIANLGDATGVRGSAAAGSLYISLHTADPGESGNQGTNETVYTNYTRIAVVRSSSGWTISGSAPTQVVNAAEIDFPQCGATGATITHFGIGSASSGAGELLYAGPLTSSLAVSNGITPYFPATTGITVTED